MNEEVGVDVGGSIKRSRCKYGKMTCNYVRVQRAAELEMKAILAAKLADDEVVEM